MGEAKRRAAHSPSPPTPISEAARSEKLGIDPLPRSLRLHLWHG